MNRKRLTGNIVVILALMFVVSSSAIGQEVKTFGEPVLITPAGQSAEGFMVRSICQKAGISATLRPLANSDSLDGVKTLILVAGGSSKGLGAAKVDDKAEKQRITDLRKSAEKKKIRVIVLHLGGVARRGPLSDDFNRLAAEGGEIIVVKEDGDKDGFFAKIAKDKSALYKPIKQPAEVLPLFKQWFGKTE